MTWAAQQLHKMPRKPVLTLQFLVAGRRYKRAAPNAVDAGDLSPLEVVPAGDPQLPAAQLRQAVLWMYSNRPAVELLVHRDGTALAAYLDEPLGGRYPADGLAGDDLQPT